MSFVSDLIKKYEGCRLTAYQDTLGFWTIGWGRLLIPKGNNWAGYTVPQSQADYWLDEDIAKAQKLAESFPHWPELNEVRQAVLTSMTFQMGVKPLQWPHFMLALEDRDYTRAAAEGLSSKWASQTKVRAQEEMEMLESGVA